MNDGAEFEALCGRVKFHTKIGKTKEEWLDEIFRRHFPKLSLEKEVG